MQILISCAKTMAAASDIALPAATEAPFRAEAEQTALQLAALTTDELARLLRVNRTIAAENRRRYLHFHDTPLLPAIAAYTGIVFKHIDPAGFSPDDFAYAQQHLNITSFLYGLLRPLDAIRSYRLEGDAVLPGPDDRTVFARWPERLTDLLIDRVRADDGILVNLASAGDEAPLRLAARAARGTGHHARIPRPRRRTAQDDRGIYEDVPRRDDAQPDPRTDLRPRDIAGIRMGGIPV